ncbi:NAD(+) kinase, partial [Klebsiella pneumoniae]|nr:NAD(+) kinase [Klebsiella pneumoniae]
VRVMVGKEVLFSTFALNEASVEKAARERMLEVVVEVDDRPLSRWGCDGVVCATPTGSTAYNFSAGGPVVWPEVEALLMVPLSAHALFAR